MSAERELSGWQWSQIMEEIIEGPTADSIYEGPLPWTPLLHDRCAGELLGEIFELALRPTTEGERLALVWRLAHSQQRRKPLARRLAEILQLPERQWPCRGAPAG